MNKQIILLTYLLVVFYTVGINAQTQIKQLQLSELNLKKVQQPYWTAQKDKAINGKPIAIKGKQFKNGIGTISGGKIFILLNGKAKRFKAWVGVQEIQKDIQPNELKFNARRWFETFLHSRY